MSEKTLPPTEHRIRQAREKGQTAVSQDLIKLVKFACVAELVFGTRGLWIERVAMTFDVALMDFKTPWSVRLNAVIDSTIPLIVFAIIVACCAAAAAFVMTLIQTGLNFAPKAFESGPERLNPAANLKQLFSGKKLLMLVLGPLKSMIVLIVCYFHVKNQLPDIVQWFRISPTQGLEAAASSLQSMERKCLIALLVISLSDWALQRYSWLKGLRMDLKEIREEYKAQEGDPHLKGKRKGIAKEVALSDKPALAAGASAVVVNPTHIAIALEYDFSPDRLPRVVGKAHGADADRMRAAAAQRGVPVFRYVSLARLLFATGKVGANIPRDLLRPVALLYRAVEEVTAEREHLGKLRHLYELDDELAQEMLNYPSPQRSSQSS